MQPTSQPPARGAAADPFLFEPVRALWEAVGRLQDMVHTAEDCGCGYCYCTGGGCSCAMCLAMPALSELSEELSLVAQEERQG